MNRKSLLKEYDRLPYAERLRRACLLALRYADDAKLPKLLDSLVSSSYEWQLRLAMAGAVGDQERVLSGLRHSCDGVRRQAALIAPRLSGLSGERLLLELEHLDQHTRRVLLRKIRQRHRSDLAEALLPALQERFGPQEAALVLAAASEETVRTKLPELAQQIKSWRTLAGRFPDTVLQYFRSEIEHKPLNSQVKRWKSLSSTLLLLLSKRPEASFQLALEAAPAELYPNNFGPYWGMVTRRFPRQTTELLCTDDILKVVRRSGLPPGVESNVRSLSYQDRERLARSQAERPGSLARLLRALAPRDRRRVFEAVFKDSDTSQAFWPEELMRVLPHSLRAQEAERMLSLRSVKEQPSKRIQCLSFLPPLSARELLLQEAASPKADERAAVLSALVRSTRYYGSEVEETLKVLQRLKNEQDPVRSAVIYELSKLSGSVFSLEHSSYLEPLVVAVLEARDSSTGTRRALSGIFLKILRTHPSQGDFFDFSLEMLEKIGWQGFQLEMREVFDFEPERCRILIQKLLPLVKEAVKRESYELLFALARFEPSQVLAEFQKLLEAATKAKPEWTARLAISHWLKNPETRDKRVVKLLARDRSHIVLWEVLQHVHKHRQDLLDPFLSNKAISGRFLQGKTIYVLSLHDGFDRWLPRQQESFAKLLLSLAKDEHQALAVRTNAVLRLAKLPDGPADSGAKFLESPEQSLREASLASLKMDPRRLLPFFERDEARVAAYTFGAVVRRLPTKHLEPLFEEALNVPLKVTAHKELIRSLGQVRGPYSLPLLEREWGKEGLHRDARIAVIHAARNLLDCRQAWTILGQAAQSLEAEVQRALLTQQPGELLPSHRSDYLELLLTVQNSSELKVRQELWLRLSSWIDEHQQSIAQVAGGCVSDLSRSDWSAAAGLLLNCCREGDAEEVFLETARALHQLSAGDLELNPDRDRPARQRLIQLTHLLLGLPDSSRQKLGGLFQEMSTLHVFPELVFRLRLAGGESLGRLLSSCGKGFEPTRGLLSAFESELKRAGEEPEAVLERALQLSTHSDHKGRRLGLLCLAKAGPRLSWSEPCRNLLARFRADADPDVALAAGMLFTSPER